jgi:hypothetical protein
MGLERRCHNGVGVFERMRDQPLTVDQLEDLECLHYGIDVPAMRDTDAGIDR